MEKKSHSSFKLLKSLQSNSRFFLKIHFLEREKNQSKESQDQTLISGAPTSYLQCSKLYIIVYITTCYIIYY